MTDLSRERIAELKRDLSDHAKRGNGVVVCDTEEMLALLSMAERAVSEQCLQQLADELNHQEKPGPTRFSLLVVRDLFAAAEALGKGTTRE